MESRLKKGLGRGLSSLLGDTSKKIDTNKISIINFNQENHLTKKVWKSYLIQ